MNTTLSDKTTLLKFRPMTSDTEMLRIFQILITGETWFSNAWDQNDGLEGVFDPIFIRDNSTNIFGEKNKKKICCFSKFSTISKPLLWGYYAQGLKGVAIEFSQENSNENCSNPVKFLPVKYDKPSTRNDLETILSTKSRHWKHEEEVRAFILSDVAKSHRIGRIANIYIGQPYKNMDNFEEVKLHSNILIDYYKRVDLLEKLCEMLNIAVSFSYISINNDNCSVSTVPKSSNIAACRTSLKDILTSYKKNFL